MGECNGLECNEIIFKQDALWNWESVLFLKIGDNMAISIKSKDNSTKSILNLLELSHMMSIYTIEWGIALVNVTDND